MVDLESRFFLCLLDFLWLRCLCLLWLRFLDCLELLLRELLERSVCELLVFWGRGLESLDEVSDTLSLGLAAVASGMMKVWFGLNFFNASMWFLQDLCALTDASWTLVKHGMHHVS